MIASFQETLKDVLADVAAREQDILRRRFGLGVKKQTLQKIGSDYNLTRERVRQLQDKNLEKILPSAQRNPFVQEIGKQAVDHLGRTKIKLETTLLASLGLKYELDEKDWNLIRFFLIIQPKLRYQPENNELRSFWGDSEKRVSLAAHILKRLMSALVRQSDKLWSAAKLFVLVEKEIKTHLGVKAQLTELKDFLHILKQIGKNPADKFGLLEHPHISPSSLDDKVKFVLELHRQPLHFTEIHQELQKLGQIEDEFLSSHWRKDYSPQSIQNLLIMNPEFVWTGMGTYALRSWGYKDGSILDLMREIVKQHKAIEKEKLIEKLSQVRKFSPITFEAYLRDKDYFTINGRIVKIAR